MRQSGKRCAHSETLCTKISRYLCHHDLVISIFSIFIIFISIIIIFIVSILIVLSSSSARWVCCVWLLTANLLVTRTGAWNDRFGSRKHTRRPFSHSGGAQHEAICRGKEKLRRNEADKNKNESIQALVKILQVIGVKAQDRKKNSHLDCLVQDGCFRLKDLLGRVAEMTCGRKDTRRRPAWRYLHKLTSEEQATSSSGVSKICADGCGA